MARGDWPRGTTFRIIGVEARFYEDGPLAHVGVGYEVVGPSGMVLATRGWNWHNEIADPKRSPDEVRALETELQKVIAHLLDEEGVALAMPREGMRRADFLSRLPLESDARP